MPHLFKRTVTTALNAYENAPAVEVDTSWCGEAGSVVQEATLCECLACLRLAAGFGVMCLDWPDDMPSVADDCSALGHAIKPGTVECLHCDAKLSEPAPEFTGQRAPLDEADGTWVWVAKEAL